MEVKLKVADSEYSEWSLVDSSNEEIIVPSPDGFDPIAQKLFHDDIIRITPEGDSVIIHSETKTTTDYLPGVLVLFENRTYGRTENKKRLLYKCIPYNKHLPDFLVPYNISLGFSKNIMNKYVIFKYAHWNEKHPRGELLEVIGDSNDDDAIDEYMIRCGKLNIPINQFTNYIREKCKNKTEDVMISEICDKYKNVLLDRTKEYVFSIDNEATDDYDDAMSIVENADGSHRVSIYIANVVLWLDYFQAWSYMTERDATIYLTNRKMTMLPPMLSDNLCSFIEKKHRFAFVMDYYFHLDGSMTSEYNIASIIVKKNHIYDSEFLQKNEFYKKIFHFTRTIEQDICNSHNLVEYWMVKTNQTFANILYKKQDGVFLEKTDKDGNLVPIRLDKTIYCSEIDILNYYILNEVKTVYILYDKLNKNNIENIELYAHTTSPIRRLVDVLNQIIIMNDFVKLTSDSLEYLNMKKSDRCMKKMQELTRELKRVEKSRMLIERKGMLRTLSIGIEPMT